MAKVNLDALIPREDFDVEENISSGKKKETISIEDLKIDSFFFSNIRKPDFQRETNEWDKNKICELIKSFIEGDLIPAIILWRSTGSYLFVIDGSHRLSALSAWVNDDYGDGIISKLFYDGLIPDEQLEVAQETRKLVNKTVGSYEDFRLAPTHPDKVKPEVVKYAKNLSYLAIQLQWVEGDATKAESSFFKINQQAAPIDKTELKLLESRKKPNSIAARAIIRSGKGHRYWSSFSNEIQYQIQEIAKEINDFIKVREQFEDCLRKYDYLIQQIYLKYKSVQKGYKDVSKMFQQIVTSLQTEKTIDNVINGIISSNDFQYLTIRTINQEFYSSAQDFNTNKKSEIFIREALQNAQKCKICNGLIHRNSISFDHIQRKEDGGSGSVDNGQITHPYCNTGYKN